jgi:hypothetical protein
MPWVMLAMEIAKLVISNLPKKQKKEEIKKVAMSLRGVRTGVTENNNEDA